MNSALRLPQLKAFVIGLTVTTLLAQPFSIAGVRPSSIAGKLAVSMNDPSTLLPTAKTKKQALLVVSIAESRPFESYFEHPEDPQAMLRLDADIKSLAVASEAIGVADHVAAFDVWWDRNKSAIILVHEKIRSASLDEAFTGIFLRFKAEELQSEKDPNAFLEWMFSRINNPVLMVAAAGSLAVISATVAYSIGIVKGALIAGPAASIVGALVDPVVRPIREKASVIGTKYLGPWGVQLSAFLFKEKVAKPSMFAKAITVFKAKVARGSSTADALAAGQDEAEEALADTSEGIKKMRAQLETMGYDITSPDFYSNMERFQKMYFDTLQVWNTTPSLVKDGRGLLNEAVIGRPQGFALQIMESVNGAKLDRMAIADSIDRIVASTKQDLNLVTEKVVTLLREIEISENAATANLAEAHKGVEEAKAALRELGASEFLIKTIADSRISELINVRHTAYTLASNIIYEQQYPEYGRDLPEQVRVIQQGLRSGMCIDYFHHAFRDRVVQILGEMQLPLEVSRKAIAEAKASARVSSPAPKENSRSLSKSKSTEKNQRAPMTCQAVFA